MQTYRKYIFLGMATTSICLLFGLTHAEVLDRLQSPDEKNRPKIIREGTRVEDQLGTFRFVGDRMSFLPPDSGETLVCLENLNLERIVRLTEDHPGPRKWHVTGRVTEFQGVNYLLIERAVLAHASERPNRKV